MATIKITIKVIKIVAFVLVVGGLGFIAYHQYKTDKNMQSVNDTVTSWDIKFFPK